MKAKHLLFQLILLISVSMHLKSGYLYAQGSAPAIASFSPASGAVGTEITINGTNFNPTPAGNVVYFGGMKATVTSATATQLKVKVPAGAASLAIISVTNTANKLTAYSTTATTPTFNVTFPGGVLDADSYNMASYRVFGGAPSAISTSDMNGDGKLDIVTVGAILYRNAANNGYENPLTFYPLPSGATVFSAFATADFNGDGKMDIAVEDFNGSAVSVILRNAANTDYDIPQSYTTADFPTGIGVGDFNGDGRTDIVTGSQLGVVSVLLRNAANTGFQKKVDYNVGVNNPSRILVADFNKDGKADIALYDQINGSNSIALLLRNAANTGFEAPVNYTLPTNVIRSTIADFNGDGRIDIAFTSSGFDFTKGEYFTSLILLLCNGANNGFSSPITYMLSSTSDNSEGLFDIVAGDFNGDGKADIAVSTTKTNSQGSTDGFVTILLRNAANTGFVERKDYETENSNPQFLTTGDLNADGKADIATTDGPFITVLLYKAPAKQEQTIDLPTIPDQKFSDQELALNATASSGLQVSYRIVSGPAKIADRNPAIVEFTGVGDVIVEVTQAGNGVYNPAPPVRRPFKIIKGDQFIDFPPIGDRLTTDPPFGVEALSSSGLTVTFSISTNPASGVASISGNILTLLGGAGTVTVTASQAGNVNYNPAEDTTQRFNVKSPTPEDTTPPIVTIFSPADNATGVTVDTDLIITFNEEIKIGNGSIIINQGGSIQTIEVTSAAVTVAGNVVTINPPQDFPEGANISVQIEAGTFKDLAGNNFAGITDTANWNFTTMPSVDDSAPMIVAFSPENNATNVSVNTNLVIDFNEKIEKRTGLISISIGASVQQISVLSDFVVISDKRVTINLPQDFPAGAIVSIQIEKGAFTDLTGNDFVGIADNTTWRFSTASPVDVTSPVMTALSPADNATNVAVDALLQITFDEDIKKGTGKITINQGSSSQVIDVSNDNVIVEGNKATINSVDNFPEGANISILLEAGVFTDLADNAYIGIADATTWNFTTADRTPPAITNLSPAANATDIDPAAFLTITFDEAVKAGNGNITINQETTIQEIPVNSAAVTIVENTVTINPPQNFSSGAVISVQIQAGAFIDEAGNAFAGITDATTWRFSVIQEFAPPLQINFQSKWVTPPQGWMKDYGLPFGEKTTTSGMLQYGWKRRDNGEAIDLSVVGSFPGNPGNGRHRTSPSDILLATLMHMQGNDVKNFRGTPVESYWEMAVENGDYQVSVSVGDGSVYTATDPESHSINVEGVAAITHFVPQGAKGSMTRFKQATVTVTVTDGYLTIDADGGRNTKITYAIIQPLFSPANLASKQAIREEQLPATSTLKAFPNPFTDKLTLHLQGWQGRVSISLQDVMGDTLLQTQLQVESAEVSLNLSAVQLKAGLYLIKITDENGSSRTSRLIKK